jgi:flavodoxin
MKTIIIYKSYHHMNTERVARVMAETMNATLVRVEDVKHDELENYDIVGFGSGIYGGKTHRDILNLWMKYFPGTGGCSFFQLQGYMEKIIMIFS